MVCNIIYSKYVSMCLLVNKGHLVLVTTNIIWYPEMIVTSHT
jgi:hypothetical protein